MKSVDWTRQGKVGAWPPETISPWAASRLPNAFLIGFPKTASTSLADALSHHPDVFLPKVKEPGWLIIDDVYSAGADAIVRSYYSRAHESVRLDATVGYAFRPYVMERIAALPSSHWRFIVSVRDPVDRAYSAYLHFRRLGFDVGSFGEVIDRQRSLTHDSAADSLHDLIDVVDQSRYAEHLSRWFERFGRERFVILRTEDAVIDPNASIDLVLRHLGIERPSIMAPLPNLNPARAPRFGLVARTSMLPAPVRKSVNRFVPFEVKQRIVDTIARLDTKPAIRTRPTTEERRMLLEVLRDDIDRFEVMTGLDCTAWRATET